MKIFLKVLFLFILFFLVYNCRTVNKNATTFDFSYRDKWQIITFDDTIKLKVIEHQNAGVHCGTLATASITIGTFKNDTIRVLNLCNLENYSKNEIVKFIPANKPDFSVVLPYSTTYNPENKKIIPGFYEKNILKTTYGYAVRNQINPTSKQR